MLLIAVVIRKVEWSALGAVLARTDLSCALLAWSLSLTVIAGLAFRWQMFLRQQDVVLPFRTVFTLTWAGQFFNSILPGSTGGDFVKIYQLCRLHPERKAVAAATVIADRLTAVVALLLLAAIAMVIEPAPLRLLSEARLPARLMVGAIIAAVVVAGILWKLLPTRAALTRLAGLVAACRNALTPNMTLAVAFFISTAIHLLNFSIVYLFARALGISISFGQTLLMMPVILFLVMLPVTVNGHGLRELLLIGYFTYFGVTVNGIANTAVQEVVVALSLLIVGNDLLWSIPGGLWYFARFRQPPASSQAQRMPAAP